MKELWSVITKSRNFHLGQHFVVPLQISHILLLIAGIAALLIINACSPEAAIEPAADKAAALIQKKQQNVAEIEDSINNSYARIAANHVDVCPKLLQKDVDRNTIKRTAEVMVDDHCDYLLYLRSGQHIAVSLDNDQIEALLIVPTLHNFANGDYQVASYDKHVIRLSYNGATYKPERLSYDVAIRVSD